MPETRSRLAQALTPYGEGIFPPARVPFWRFTVVSARARRLKAIPVVACPTRLESKDKAELGSALTALGEASGNPRCLSCQLSTMPVLPVNTFRTALRYAMQVPT